MVVSWLLRNLADCSLLRARASVYRRIGREFLTCVPQDGRCGAAIAFKNLLARGNAFAQLCGCFAHSLIEQAHAGAYQFECAISRKGYWFRAAPGFVLVLASAG